MSLRASSTQCLSISRDGDQQQLPCKCSHQHKIKRYPITINAALPSISVFLLLQYPKRNSYLTRANTREEWCYSFLLRTAKCKFRCHRSDEFQPRNLMYQLLTCHFSQMVKLLRWRAVHEPIISWYRLSINNLQFLSCFILLHHRELFEVYQFSVQVRPLKWNYCRNSSRILFLEAQMQPHSLYPCILSCWSVTATVYFKANS